MGIFINSLPGAGSLVTKDVPANSVAVGNPYRVLRPIGERDYEFYWKDRRIGEEDRAWNKEKAE